MVCNSVKSLIQGGDIIIFNPNDKHSCVKSDTEIFVYKAINISKDVIKSFCREITDESFLPYFSENVITDRELYQCISNLHEAIMNKSEKFEKEELILITISNLIFRYSNTDFSLTEHIENTEIEKICKYLENNYDKKISLDDLCSLYGYSKSSLLREFSKKKNITPYRYLQTIRIEKAKELLKNGISPAVAANLSGFFDQSHMTKCFNSLIGLSPSIYINIFRKQGE